MNETAIVGTKGFLFCDLRGYTAFVEARGDAAAAELLATYRELVRAVIAAHAGAEIRTEGDSVYVVFPAASAAVEAGLEIVAAAAEASTREAPIRVGVGIHAGETVATTEGLVGGAVNIAARVCAKAQAGEVLVTDTVRALTRTFLPYTYTSLGTQQLKGIAGGIPLFRVEAVPSSGRARIARQLGARRGRLAILAGLVVVALVAATGASALNRPPDCLTLPACDQGRRGQDRSGPQLRRGDLPGRKETGPDRRGPGRDVGGRARRLDGVVARSLDRAEHDGRCTRDTVGRDRRPPRQRLCPAPRRADHRRRHS